MTEKPTLLILSGLQGSGKTTCALRWVAEDPKHRRRMNWDELRIELFGPNWVFNRKEEGEMQSISRETVSRWLDEGLSVVIDNTNLTEKSRALWRSVAQGATIEEYEVDTPVATCVARDRKREGKARIGRAIIERLALFTGWIDWNDLPPKWNPSRGQPDIVVVDIDGTLSDPAHRLHHIRCVGDCTCAGKCRSKNPRWDLFHAEVDKDEPKPIIIDLVRRLSLSYWIIIVSGRSPEHGCGIKTEDWLEKHLDIPYVHLFMRQSGDTKPDYIHKKEVLDLLPKDRIAFVLDDRQQVVDMWRDNGLTCLQVAKGAF
jgi:predicted kinase